LYARLTDRVSGTTANTTVAQQIVDEAEAEANSYLATRYATPVSLAQHPELADLLAQRVLDLAEYLAWRGSPFVNDLPGRVKALQGEARRWFEQVAAGMIDLPAAAPPASRVAADDAPRYSAGERPFTADELDGL
jgi:phage gp36-like protein